MNADDQLPEDEFADDEFAGLSEVDDLTPEEAELDEPKDAELELDELMSDEPPETGRPTDPDLVDAESEQMAERIDTEIHGLAAERDQFRDIAQRLQADFENYRRRMSAQIATEVERATGKLAEALLPVLDAAEAAYVQHPDEIGPLLNLMLAELRKHGLESIDLLDKAFDPNLADAVAHEPGEGGEPVVAEVLRSGYSWNGRTLRPAMVRTRS